MKMLLTYRGNTMSEFVLKRGTAAFGSSVMIKLIG